MKDMKVTFSDTSREFSTWVREKNDDVLLGLCELIKEQHQIVNSKSFLFTLDSALKLFALSYGNLNGIRCKMVSNLLINYNVDGYYFLKDLINNTMQSDIMKQIMQSEYNEEILKLIEENNKLNRRILAEKLAKSDYTNNWTVKIAEDIEYVHNGEKTWDWFYNIHKNDRNKFNTYFKGGFIKEVYDYFHSDDYLNADIVG